MTPKTLVEEWVRLFNEGNAQALGQLYAEEAINHQVANSPLKGKKPSSTVLKPSLLRPK